MRSSKAESRAELCRRYLLAFTVATKKDYKPSWHHKINAQHLEAVERGDIDRLMIMEPPRHGKSELTSIRFPPWAMGRNPKAKIIACSYSDFLVHKFGRQARNICASGIYKEIFGDLLARDATAATFWAFQQGGEYIGAGRGAGITGTGAKYLLLDDLFKSRKEANSLTYREWIWDWYRNDAYTRLEEGGAIIAAMTHWHEDDWCGRALNDTKDGGDRWTLLNFPAVCESEAEEYRNVGEALWPERFSIEKLERIRKTLGDKFFNALFQQRPTLQEGNLFKRQNFKYWTNNSKLTNGLNIVSLPERFDSMIQSWDFSFKDLSSSDYVVGQVWGIKRPSAYLLYQVRGQMGFTESVKAVLNMTQRFPAAKKKLIEDKANGPAIMNALKGKVKDFVEVNPDGNKEERAELIEEYVNQGNVIIPHPSEWQDVEVWLKEVCNFPGAANDDQVDAFTQAIQYAFKPQKLMDIIELDI